MAPDVAEAEAERRLGPPDRLAADLVEAHRAPRAMLVAAGGGIVAMAGRTVLALFGAGVIVSLLLVAVFTLPRG